MSEINVILKRSVIGAIPKHRKTVQALGLKKINQVAKHKDNEAIRGMVRQVSHLVEIIEN